MLRKRKKRPSNACKLCYEDDFQLHECKEREKTRGLRTDLSVVKKPTKYLPSVPDTNDNKISGESNTDAGSRRNSEGGARDGNYKEGTISRIHAAMDFPGSRNRRLKRQEPSGQISITHLIAEEGGPLLQNSQQNSQQSRRSFDKIPNRCISITKLQNEQHGIEFHRQRPEKTNELATEYPTFSCLSKLSAKKQRNIMASAEVLVRRARETRKGQSGIKNQNTSTCDYRSKVEAFLESNQPGAPPRSLRITRNLVDEMLNIRPFHAKRTEKDSNIAKKSLIRGNIYLQPFINSCTMRSYYNGDAPRYRYLRLPPTPELTVEEIFSKNQGQ